MSVLKYYDGTGWVELPAISPQGPAGLAGAPGPAGPAGPAANTSHLVLNAGDTMTGALTLPAAPIAPLETATKKYVDDQGMPESSMYGTVTEGVVATDTTVTVTPVPTAISGLTINGDSIVLNRTGYYLAHFFAKWSSGIPEDTRAFLEIIQTTLSLTNVVRGRRATGPEDTRASVDALIWGTVGETLSFRVRQASGGPLTLSFVEPDAPKIAIRFLGENH